LKIVLLGPQGQVGGELQRSLAPLGEVIALGREGHRQYAGLTGDLSQPDALVRSIAQIRPQAIVNAAAYTAVDQAEVERERAFAINASAVGALARAAHDCDAWLVHYSTDYVFDGTGTQPWRESDATRPVNAYGQSKLAGEEAIRSTHARHLILRCSWVFEAWGQNFLKSILRAAQQRDQLRVVADQHGAPTRAALIADVTAHALRILCAAPDAESRALAGTYHLSPRGETNWHAYAQRIVEQAAQHGLPIKARAAAIEPIASADYPTAAKRPHNSRMDASRLERAFGLTLPPWQQGVDAVVAELAALATATTRSA
jgi:dTDP-4-dehydrorhamnose reductase